MNESDFQKIKEIFAAALEVPAENRAPFLREKCGADSSLLAEVQSLLATSGEAENLLDKNAFNFAPLTTSKLKNYQGRQFGNYKIIREIGAGGMGAVFLADRADGEFHQKVALKIVRQTVLDDETERHFRREREILASLNHPNIAQLHDGGVSDAGEAFLAMEYVEGETLLEFADTQNLSIEERLRLFLKICAAVSYAHRNLTIHRDLKPSNILVTKNGEPKLLDFGLAKILDENLLDQNQTATIFRAFTPAYASPEQILGKKVTTASDVFSLGVVFYELLTGAKPFHFEGKSLEEIVQTVTNSEPTAPSANPKSQIPNPKSLKGDLDNIALKALKKEPERRYKSVEEFSGDIERHLEGLPVLARPATFFYRVSKFFQRNKIAVSASAIVILSIITGLIFTLWQANETRKERDRAEKRFNDVRKLSNSLLFEIAPRIERLQGSTKAREILVLRALEYLDSLANESQTDAALQSELASAYEKIGDLQGNIAKPNLSDFAGAIKSYEKAGAIRRNLPKMPGNQTLLAENFRALANIRFVQNDIKGSLQNSEEALKIYETLLAENPSSFQLQTSFIETRLDYSQTYSNNNQYEIAIPLLRQALEEIEKLEQNNVLTQKLSAKCLSYLGNALSWDNQQTEAEIEMAKAVAISEKLSAEFPNDTNIRQTVWRVYSLASSIHESIKDDISLQFAEKALNIAKKAVESDSADTQAKQNLARSFSRFGIISILVNKVPEGFVNLEKAEKLLVELVEKEPKNQVYQDDLGSLYTRFGDAEKKRGNLQSSLKYYQKSADIFEQIALTDEKNTVAHRDWAQSLKSVAVVYLKLNEKAQAKENFLKATELVKRLKQQNALGNWDEKIFDEMQPILDKL